MPTLSRTVKYHVRFVCYQYNCGGTMTNGNKPCALSFNDVDKAKGFADRVKALARQADGTIPEGSNAFARDYVHDGFVELYVGIFCITEEQIA